MDQPNPSPLLCDHNTHLVFTGHGRQTAGERDPFQHSVSRLPSFGILGIKIESQIWRLEREYDLRGVKMRHLIIDEGLSEERVGK